MTDSCKYLTSNPSGAGGTSLSGVTSGSLLHSPYIAHWLLTTRVPWNIFCLVGVSSKRSMLSTANQILAPFTTKSGKQKLTRSFFEAHFVPGTFQGQGSSGSYCQCTLLPGC